jgi:tetratricopeptide (TPR) repeat protein
MGHLEVLFEVPNIIEHGLATGMLERVGGVIRHVGSKQVVAWLRDGILTDTAGQLLSTAANPLSSVMQAAQVASSVYDKYVTRNMIASLGSKISTNHLATMAAINSLGASVQMVTAISSVTLGGQLLNLALSGVTLLTINQRLDEMTKQIESLGEKILAEFEQDRDARFEMALEAAQDVFESKNEKIRDEAHRSAINGLSEARLHALANFEKAMASKSKQLNIAQHCLIKAIYAEITRIRCYLTMGDSETAINHFKKTLPIFQLATERLIREWLGKKSAVYFHKDVATRSLARYLRIQQWLRGVLVGDNPVVIFEILNEMRSQFWDEGVLEDKLFRKISRTGSSVIARKAGAVIDAEQNSRLANNLFQAELLIENYERLLGFEMEMRENRLEFREWEELVSAGDLAEHGAALIVDTEILKRLQIEQ